MSTSGLAEVQRKERELSQRSLTPSMHVLGTKKPGEIARSSAGLRELLFKQMEAVQAGDATPQDGLAVAALAQQIIASVRMELDFAIKMKSLGVTTHEIGKPVQLDAPSDKE